MQVDATKDTFFDACDPSAEGYIIYHDEDTGKDERVKYYDPADDISEKDKFGRAIPLTMNCSHLIRATEFHEFINELSDDDLFGRDVPFDTFEYINENNIFAYTSTTSREDIDIEDEDYPALNNFFGKDEPEQKPIDLTQQFTALATMHKLKKRHKNWGAI